MCSRHRRGLHGLANAIIEKTAVGREDVVFDRAGSRKSWLWFLQLTERLITIAERGEWIGSRPL